MGEKNVTLVPGEGASRGHQLSPLRLNLQVLREPFYGACQVFRQIGIKMNTAGDLDRKKNSLKRRYLEQQKACRLWGLGNPR